MSERRSSRRRSRRRSAGTKGVVGWIIASLCLVLVLTGLGAAYVATSKAVPHDEVTGCPIGKPPSALTVVLIDATDGVNAIQRQALVNRLSGVFDSLSLDERVELHVLQPDAVLPPPQLVLCRPARPDEVSDLTGNRRLAFEHYQSHYLPVLQAALATALSGKPSTHSPILESIQQVAVRALQSPDLPASKSGFSRHLVVVSDMLQLSPLANHYRDPPDYEAFRGRPGSGAANTDLTGVAVQILYLRRPNGAGIQGGRHIAFWDAWFSAQGAHVDSVVPIEG